MKIGLLDVDSYHFPNLPLMKLSAHHKAQGDTVEWWSETGSYDRVYMSKVFDETYTSDIPEPVNAAEIVKGGTGYGLENRLPDEIEHTYPDYSLYPKLTKDTAYGFLTRGCCRGCSFCIVSAKEGRQSRKVADLSEFWRGQKHIKLLDPNLTACKEWRDIFGQLAESGAWVDLTQGLDIRLMTEDKIAELMKIKVKQVHFAWDNYEDREMIVPKLKKFAEITGWSRKKLNVYVLTNYNTTLEQDLERIYTLREMGYMPYVMIYNKQETKKGSDLRKLQRWVNSKVAFMSCKRFEDFR